MKKDNNQATAVSLAKEKIEDVGNRFDKTKEKVSGNLSNAAEKIHEKSDNAQDFLSNKIESAEDIVRKKAYEAGDLSQQTLSKANEFGHRAADALENSSKYIKNFDVNEAKDSVKQTLKQKPEIGIALAGTFGLLLGLIIGSRRSK